MDEATFQFLKSGGFVLSFALVFILQVSFPYRRGRVVPRNWRQNVPLAILNAIVLSLVCGACLCTLANYAEARHLGLLRMVAVPGWAGALITLIAFDLVLWAWHLANHQVAWLWRFHQVHHADTEFDLSTSLRFHCGELLLSLPLKIGVVLLLGAPLLGILLFESVFGLFNLFVHGNIRLPLRLEAPLLRLFVLPAAHRLHHSVLPEEHELNFGTIFSFWDRCFRTWKEARSGDAIVTGLPGFLGAQAPGFWRLLGLPFQASRSRSASESG